MTEDQLKTAIKKSGLKKSFIAEQLDRSNTLITRWIQGTLPIPEKHIPVLKALLNIK